MELEITAIIQAGGMSSRMGKDKGLVRINSQTLVERTVHLVEQVTDHIMIIANKEGYKKFGIPVHPDILKGYGPAGGIHSGLFHTKTKHNLVVACDMPFLSIELLKYLIQQTEDDFEAIVPEYKGTPQPLCAIYSKQTLRKFEGFIHAGQLKMRWVIEQLNTKYITINEELDCFAPDLFENINTEKDLLRVNKHCND